MSWETLLRGIRLANAGGDDSPTRLGPIVTNTLTSHDGANRRAHSARGSLSIRRNRGRARSVQLGSANDNEHKSVALEARRLAQLTQRAIGRAGLSSTRAGHDFAANTQCTHSHRTRRRAQHSSTRSSAHPTTGALRLHPSHSTCILGRASTRRCGGASMVFYCHAH